VNNEISDPGRKIPDKKRGRKKEKFEEISCQAKVTMQVVCNRQHLSPCCVTDSTYLHVFIPLKASGYYIYWQV
jgi:hypothetical protein